MKSQLSKILVSDSIISEEEFNKILGNYEIEKKHIGIALVNLGYPQRGVKSAVEEVMKGDHPDRSFETLFKLILKNISNV